MPPSPSLSLHRRQTFSLLWQKAPERDLFLCKAVESMHAVTLSSCQKQNCYYVPSHVIMIYKLKREGVIRLLLVVERLATGAVTRYCQSWTIDRRKRL